MSYQERWSNVRGVIQTTIDFTYIINTVMRWSNTSANNDAAGIVVSVTEVGLGDDALACDRDWVFYSPESYGGPDADNLGSRSQSASVLAVGEHGVLLDELQLQRALADATLVTTRTFSLADRKWEVTFIASSQYIQAYTSVTPTGTCMCDVAR